ncbi:toll/interleukin-1 receptor domain-containing protein [Haliovirga abyssi]|nr:toll/interleukin-1 receptor domain-containing protein [Haliovirga abyssi]
MKKIFLSYCWERYDQLVIDLATKLSSKYDVILDKWEIRPGHNIDSFMENSIREAEKVFVICEKEYVNKANNRISGVGVETSIISPKVYRNTKQEKFIPVFLEGISVKPDYMESIFGIELNPSFDLNDEKLNEFINAIEGKPIVEKPKFELSTQIEIPDRINNISIDEKVKKGLFDSEVYSKILKILEEDLIAKFIVKYHLNNFGKIIIKFEEINQIKILDSIDSNYVQATGYGGWDNYDLFGKTAYDVGMGTENEVIKKRAKLILENCANIKCNLEELLDDFNKSNL